MPIPILIALGGAIAVAAGVAGYKTSKCNCCGSSSPWNHKCPVCSEPVCADCGTAYQAVTYKGVELQPKVRCCNAHVPEMLANLAAKRVDVDRELERQAEAARERKRAEAEELERQAEAARKRERAEAESGQVLTYRKAYQGKMKPLRQNKKIQTEFLKDRECAERELKIMAVLEGCFVIQQVEFESQLNTDGAYKYRTWSASGMI